MIYWFTGQPGAGKSTLAIELKSVLEQRGYPTVHLDGEDLRQIMDNRDFSEAGRRKNIAAAQSLALKLAGNGIAVVASFVSPYRQLREEFKRNDGVVEVYVHTSAIRGREGYFVKAYEPPLENFVDVDTTAVSVADCIGKILKARPLAPSRFVVRA